MTRFKRCCRPLAICLKKGKGERGEWSESRSRSERETQAHPLPPLPPSAPTEVLDGPTKSVGKANNVLTSCRAILYLSTASNACALLKRDLTSSGFTSKTLVQSEMTPSKLESCL